MIIKYYLFNLFLIQLYHYFYLNQLNYFHYINKMILLLLFQLKKYLFINYLFVIIFFVINF